jgi:PilZ domain
MKPHPFPRYRPLPSVAPLVWESGGGTLKLERRQELREAASGAVSASFSDGACRFGIAAATLVDRSPGGVGLETISEITPGMRVQIRAEGSAGAWFTGVAVRCEAAGAGFRVGVRLASRLAA